MVKIMRYRYKNIFVNVSYVDEEEVGNIVVMEVEEVVEEMVEVVVVHARVSLWSSHYNYNVCLIPFLAKIKISFYRFPLPLFLTRIEPVVLFTYLEMV